MNLADKDDELEDDLDVLDQDEAETETPDAEIEPGEGEEDEELVVTIGEDSPAPEEEKAPKWVKDLRVKTREQAKRIRELEQIAAQVEQQNKPQLGPKPTLESVGWDAEAYEKALDTWKERKAAHDREQETAAETERKQREAWQAKLDGYNARKAELKVKDFEDVEEAAKAVFTDTQLGIMIDGAKDPALLLYALGKNPAKLAELSKETNPIQFAFAVARMETQLKTSSRKPSAAPEKPVRGSASSTGADKREDQLIAEAQRTGDATKLRQYRAARKQGK